MSRQNIFSLSIILDDGCQVHDKLGNSPLGDLYHVEHPHYGTCALKHFEEAVLENNKFAQKFLAPLGRLTELTHPNLAQIYWVNDSFVLRELVMGTSLQKQIQNKVVFSLEKSTQIIWDIAMALFGGYSYGIVFKNIKPANVILLPNGRARLVDISLPPSCIEYLAPELWQETPTSHSSDIYALGVIYYQMLTGQFPFKKTQDNIKKIDLQHLPQEIPESIALIIEKMLSPSEKRYQSPLSLITSLKQELQSLNIETQTMSTADIFKKTAMSKTTTTPVPEMKGGTMMMMGMSRKTEEEVTEEDVLEEESEINTTRKMNYDEYIQIEEGELIDNDGDYENIYLSQSFLENDLEKALETISHVEQKKERKGPLPPRIVHFPKGYEYKIVEHLQKTFRRETWLLKESDTPGKMEIEIDLEQSYILWHFYRYEDQMQESIRIAQESASQSHDMENVQTFVDKAKSGPEIATVAFDDKELESIEQQEKQTENSEQATIAFSEEELEEIDRENLNTVVENDEEVICLEEASDNSTQQTFLQTINDITVGGKHTTEQKHEEKTGSYLVQSQAEFTVDFSDPYQTMGWAKFLHEHNLKRQEHFDVKEQPTESTSTKKFVIHIEQLEDYKKEQENIARIKEFFEGDYEISELDRGGMGMVLKLIARNDPTILSVRPENLWARQKYSEYLKVVKDSKGREICYAEIPKGMEFVVKVAFEGHEESLVREARILSMVAFDPHICHTIIGAIQQGRLFTLDEKSDQTQIGYYVMLEYASEGDAEKLYSRFPDGKVSTTIGFALMYGMAQTLQKLDRQGIIHRDIKPHNILLDSNGVPKLSDFGLAITTKEESDNLTEERRRLLRVMDQEFLHISRRVEEAREKLSQLQKQWNQLGDETSSQADELDGQIEQQQAKTRELEQKEEQRAEELKGKYRLMSAKENAEQRRFAGSLYYSAPEQLDPEYILTPKCDVYQLGALMYTLFTGKRPVAGKTTVEIMSKVLDPNKPEVIDHVEKKPIMEVLSDITRKMMEHSPEQRPTANEIKEQLDRVLFEHALALKELPQYETQTDESMKQKQKSQIEFVHDLHQKCVQQIFSTIFQNQEMPELSKEVEKIVFNCPHCKKKLHLYRHMDGKKGKCPGCRQSMMVKLDL